MFQWPLLVILWPQNQVSVPLLDPSLLRVAIVLQLFEGVMKALMKFIYPLILRDRGRRELKDGGLVYTPNEATRNAEKTLITRWALGAAASSNETIYLCCAMVMVYRLKVLTSPLTDGQRSLKAFNNIKTFKKLPHFTGKQWLMLLQWMPAAIQNGDGVLSEKHTLVCFCSRSFLPPANPACLGLT